jgi:hypothetical protein
VLVCQVFRLAIAVACFIFLTLQSYLLYCLSTSGLSSTPLPLRHAPLYPIPPIPSNVLRLHPAKATGVCIVTPPSPTADAPGPTDRAYVFYASNDQYGCGAVVNMARLRRLGGGLPSGVGMLLLATDGVSAAVRRAAEREGGEVINTTSFDYQVRAGYPMSYGCPAKPPDWGGREWAWSHAAYTLECTDSMLNSTNRDRRSPPIPQARFMMLCVPVGQVMARDFNGHSVHYGDSYTKFLALLLDPDRYRRVLLVS